MDSDWMSALPEDFRSGLFSKCGAKCSKWSAALRISHTNAADTDLMRVALKFDTGRLAGVVDLHFTETMTSFPIADRSQLEAFSYSIKHGMGWALAKYPVQMAKMGYNAYALKNKFADSSKLFGPTGKDYYSMTPFQIGGENGQAAGAMKWRLRPWQRTEYPEVGEGDVKQAMRKQFANFLNAEGDLGFDLEIQVATDAVKHPVHDASVEWDAPWVKMGTVRLPQQYMASEDAEHAVGSGLTSKKYRRGEPIGSKDLLFAPGSTPHKPLGDINLFRAHFYPKYDKARQKHLLGKKSGRPAECPFKAIMGWLR